MAFPIVPVAILAGIFLLAGGKKKKKDLGEGPIPGVDPELCLEQAAATLGGFLTPDVAVEPEFYEQKGFIHTARAMRQQLPLQNPLLLDLQAADGATLLDFAEELHAASTDANDQCIDEPLCFAADCLFAVGSIRLQGLRGVA